MFFCPNCGRQLPDDTKFCVGCGANLTWRTGEGHPGTVQPQQTTAGQTRQQSQQPRSQQPEQTQARPQPQRPAQEPRAPKPKKSHLVRNIAIGVVAAVLLLLVACAVLSGGLGSDSDSSDDEDAVYSDVVYYDDEDTVEVLGSTTIVFYNDEDEALEDYDVTFMDGSGNLYRYHVDGADFRPDDLGLEPGRYRMIAREPETNLVRTVPQIVVVDEDELEDSEDIYDDIYDDELIIMPDSDDTGDEDGSTTSALQAAYTLYYERVLELQELYGEGVLDSAGEHISGVSIVLLVDLTGDGDGIDELAIVYEDGDGELTVEVWTYDAETNDIDLVCSEPIGDTDDATMLSVYGHEDAATLHWSHWPSDGTTETFENHVVLLEDGELAHHVVTYSSNYTTDETGYSVDGETVDEAGWSDARDKYIYDEDWNSNISWCLGVWSAEDWATYVSDDGSYACYDPTDTLANTEETIELLKFGMMGTTEDELWGDGSEDSDDTEAAASAACLELLEEYEASYGTLSVADASGEYPYLTGLCFADLVDFDGDGTDELVLAYSTDAVDTENGSNDNYVVEVWAYDGDGLVLVHQGCEYAAGNGFVDAGVALYYVGDVCYLVEGHDTVELYVYAYEDGAFTEVDVAISDLSALTVTWLMYYGETYSSASTTLSETLAELGAS